MNSESKNKGRVSGPNIGMVFADAIMQELFLNGVEQVCICPGSRSALLSIAARQITGFDHFILLDERSCGFFALGLAKASNRPVALICTSGTAVANFYPAVLEAYYSKVPLVVLTADRPHELREWGAGQTIDQVRIFGSHVRWFAEASIPEATSDVLRSARSLSARATSIALGPPPGPVHINLPFREPLEPSVLHQDIIFELSQKDTLAIQGRVEYPFVTIDRGAATPTQSIVDTLLKRITEVSNGIICCGTLSDRFCQKIAEPVSHLARICQWPIVADPTSQVRFGNHTKDTPVIAHSDLFLREPSFLSTFTPYFVLRIGSTPIGKSFRRWVESNPQTETMLIDPDYSFSDPLHTAAMISHCDPTILIDILIKRLEGQPNFRENSLWLKTWQETDEHSTEVINSELNRANTPLESHIFTQFVQHIPENLSLFLSNSMPIRYVDMLTPVSNKSIKVYCNRGVNGIDGIVSTALGVSAFTSTKNINTPTLLIVGDLAFLHDIGGLFAASRYHPDIVIMVINNNGGEIFSLLPLFEHRETVFFDELFTVSHGLSMEPIAAMYGIAYFEVQSLDELWSLLKKSFSIKGAKVLEIKIDKEQSLELLRHIVTRVSSTVAQTSHSKST